MKKRLATLLACALMCISAAVAQTKITGTVVSADDGQPVMGATVMVVGTKLGSATDANGKFSLTLPQGKSQLQVSYIGLATKTVTAKNGMRIVMQTDANALDEVMVVAYGTAKRSAFTGSAGVLKADKIEQRVVSNVTNALAGQVAGVQTISGNGQPGESAKIRIRGIGSMSSSNSPLYVVDGVPYDGNIANINPQDIESMTVLKDASANAIYGARGANGVVLITTKSGKVGEEPKVTFDAKWGSNSRAVPQYDVIGAGEYYETQYKALYNSKYYHGSTSAEAHSYARQTLLDADNGGLGYQVFTVPEGQSLVGENFRLNPNATPGYSDGEYYYQADDWYDESFQNNLRQEYNANVTGSSGKLNYYASVGYLNDTGIIKNSGFDRYTGRGKVDYQMKDWLKIGTNLAYSYSHTQKPDGQTGEYDWGGSSNIFYTANTIGPIYPMYVRNADGSIAINEATGKATYDSGTNTNFKRPSVTGNAARDIDYNRSDTYIDDFTGKWYAVLTPLKGLSVTGNITVNSQNQRRNLLYSTFASQVSTDGMAYVVQQRDFTVNSQLLAEYKTSIAKLHNIDILAGAESYSLKDQVFYGYNTYLYDPYVGELNNANGTDEKEVHSYTNNYSVRGFLARVQYDYDGKYFFSGSFRRDASSRFSPDNRWGSFGSVGGAWLITKEDFMKDVKWVDLLKLKASWGVQGNDHLLKSDGTENYYAYQDQYETSYSSTTKTYSTTLVYKGNQDLTWETSYSLNIGVDFELFKGRLNGSFEYFNRKTKDLLYNQPTPTSSGNIVGSIPMNIGSIRNEGVELDLNGVLLKTKDIEWTANLNLTHYDNEITDLADNVKETGIKGSYYIYKIGGSLYNSYLVSFAGVDPDNGEALYYVDPDNGDYSTTNDYSKAARADQGSTLPDIYGGFGTTLRAYGFDFSVQMSYQLGGKIYDGTYQAFMHNGGDGMQGTNWSTDIRNAWTPENRYTNVPRLDAADDCYQLDSNRFLISSNYLSLNNITLGYTLPKKWTSAIGAGSVRFYVTGDNLYVWSKRKGLDPRYSLGVGSSTYGSGNAQSDYSVLKSISGGVTLTF